jgi:hypothetical protein
MTEVEYQSLINAIQQFQPKTVSTFFNLISHFKTVNGFTVYLSFFIFPLAFIFDKKNRKTTGALIIYFLIQLFYWFFIATHQIRFFTTGTLTAIILSALAISLVKKRYFIALVFLLLVMCLYSKGPFFKTAWRNFWYTKLNVVRRQYALGNESDE